MTAALKSAQDRLNQAALDLERTKHGVGMDGEYIAACAAVVAACCAYAVAVRDHERRDAPVTVLVQQLIAKLRREQEKDEPGCDAVLAASRSGWNARSQTLIRELEQMQAEARAKEQA